MRWCFLLSHAERALIGPRSPAMLEIENRPFERDVSEPLLVARNLVRIYDQVLGEPLPAAPALGSATGDLDEAGRASDGSHGRRLATTGASLAFDARR